MWTFNITSTAGVAIIQRFVHALVLDGVYVEEGRILRFQESMPPTDVEMADCSDHRSVCPSLLARYGVLDDLGMGSDSWREVDHGYQN